MLASIGIQKGKPFKPDARTVAILDSAVRDARLYLINKMETMEAFGGPFWSNRRWRMLSFTPEVVKTGAQWVFPDRVDYDARDGSVNVYIGPRAPAGKEANWVSTRPDEGYFLGFRFYGPQKTFYDRAWTPSDVEKIN